MRLVCATLLAFALAGCSKLMGYSDGGQKSAPIKQYPDGVAGLKELAGDILDAARKDDRDRVHDLLASTIMSDADLVTLFGPEASVDLVPRYHKLMETLVNRGAVEFVAQVYDRKLDDVEVLAVDASSKDATAEDRAIAKALKVPVQLYSVRFKKATETRGLRYDFFFYRNGKWVTGNQLGRYLPGYHPPDAGAH
jgi:hypothetical protein